MVSYKEILASNALITESTVPRIAVFVGGTSGIGRSTIKALVATGLSMRIYLIGRKSSFERMQTLVQELQAVNSKADIIWTEGEISLLAETRRVCEIIAKKESRVDLLFLTTGYAPFGARVETSEGLEVTQSLAYYSRVMFIWCLLPLLRAAEAPRVVSVLGGGMERGNIDLEDINLTRPGNFGPMKAQMQYISMNTIAMEQFANENPDVTFIHSWPGWVNTGNVRRGLDPTSWMGWVIWLLLEPLIALFSLSDEESGQRHLFQSTNAAFGDRGVPWTGKEGITSLGKQGVGLFLVNYKCDCTPNEGVVSLLMEKAQVKIWDHTRGVIGSYMQEE